MNSITKGISTNLVSGQDPTIIESDGLLISAQKLIYLMLMI